MLTSLSGQAFEPLGTYGSEIMSGLGSLGNWAANLATGGNAQVQGTMPANGVLANTGSTIYSPFGSVQGTTTGGGTTGGVQSALAGVNTQELGPFLSQAVQDLLQAQGSTGYLQNLLKGLPAQAKSEFAQANSLFGAGTGVFNQGQNLLNMATTGTGLFPSQQAMINQAVSSQQHEISQQLANAGLSASTQHAQLLGQAALSGAAAGGQLIQQNIAAANQTMATGIAEQQLGTTEQQIAQDTQKIGLQAQGDLFNQFATISQLSGGLQQQMYSEAMAGYGMLGQFMQNTVSAFGYSLKSAEDVQNVMLANAGFQLDQAKIDAGAQQASAQGFSSMLGSLGGLLGSGGSGGGGALGGLGGLLGSFGATSPITGTVGGLEVAGGATAGTGLLGSLGGAASGAVGAIGSALGALFCEVARTVYGVDSPDWLLFRDWVLFRAPRSLRTLYVIHAFRVSRWIKGRPLVCRLIRWAMNAVLWYDDKITGKRT